MNKPSSMLKILEEELPEEDVLKLVMEYDNKFTEIEKENKDYKEKFDKIIEYLGIDEEILKTCEIYDVNGIEVYKILQGVGK